MKRWAMTYDKKHRGSPMSFWVHVGVDENELGYWHCATFDPPFPPPDPFKGYPRLVVNTQGVELYFASMLELDHCVEVLGQKLLPTTYALSQQRRPDVGPNRHWLSRLPASIKPWRKRQAIVKDLLAVKREVQKAGIAF